MNDYERGYQDGLRATKAGIPPEPPVGTWVKDKYGAVHYHRPDGWAAAPIGFYAFGKWEMMWKARGPLTVCDPWGNL